ncbi:MAG: DUF6142 family protein [Lachnospiraceae bacterium]|nr:DUF6142 family protein [Lachnospiraceae bacterium]
MARKGYIFISRKHSVPGIMSTVFGGLSLCTFVLCIYSSYLRAGAGAERLATAAFFAAVFMVIGFILGIFATQEDNRFALFKVLGMLLNTLALLALSAILYAGAYVG